MCRGMHSDALGDELGFVRGRILVSRGTQANVLGSALGCIGGLLSDV